jgi:molecular chaperone DnaK (HSP70)
MRPGEVWLAVDYGSAATVAVVAWPDGRWIPLVFDGSPVLPSAVLVQADGALLTGQRAWQAAVEQPDRLVVAPLRVRGQSVTAGGVEVEVLDLVAATLRRVAGEAEWVAGGRVADVRLVVPAGWGPRRRTWMRQAAYRAGLGQPVLVEAPVAVGEHLLASGVQLAVGSFIVVCDVGAGFEASVLRRGPSGFEVLSTFDDLDAGGFGRDRSGRCCVAGSMHALYPGGGRGQIAWASSAKAVDTRVAGGASTASS